MFKLATIKKLFSALLILFIFTSCQTASNNENNSSSFSSSKKMTYKQVEGAKPLKGLFPSCGTYRTLPHSMEHLYFPFEQIMTAPDTADFTLLDSKIQTIANRGHHTVLRIYLDYPDRAETEDGTPQWIYDLGIEKHTYERETNGRTVYGTYPDYSDPRLIEILTGFIEKLAQKYDSDPRLGFMECGLIGHWGEWHTTDNIAMPSDAQKIQLLTAYTQNFKNIKLLLRYPDDSGSKDFPSIGFHDDSFTYSTLGTSDWYFYPKMTQANTTERYKTAPIGGEMYPSNQPDFVCDTTSNLNRYQSFEECAQTTRISFMKCSKAFNTTIWNTLTDAQKKRLADLSDMTGYNLSITSADVSLADKELNLKVKIQNKGLARFYYKWKVKILVIQNSSVIETINTDWDITSILPDSEPVEFLLTKDLSSDFSKNTKLAIMVENPLKNGTPFKFANKETDSTNYWTILN